MRFPLASTAGGDAGLFTSAPASISAFTNAAWPRTAATCRAVLLSSVITLFTSTPDSSRALTAGTLPCSAAQKSGSVIQFFPILTKCALIFAFIDRTPSTLHTVSLYALFTCAKRSVSVHIELGQYLRCEHVGQLHGECLEDGNTTAPQKRHHIALVFVPLPLLRDHGAVACRGRRPRFHRGCGSCRRFFREGILVPGAGRATSALHRRAHLFRCVRGMRDAGRWNREKRIRKRTAALLHSRYQD